MMDIGDKRVQSSIIPTYNGGGRRMQGRVKQILVAFAVMTFPLIIFSGLLLGLVFHYRVTQNDFSSKDLAFSFDQRHSNAYLVHISATTLTTVASWSSTLAPILVGFAVTLISYPVARGLLSASEMHDTTQLPTPFQLSLMVSIIQSGSISGLWNWLTYSFGWRGRRESQGKGIKKLTIILILGTMLSTFVLITDTWLHFTTKTINFTQVYGNHNASDLGFGVAENCTNVDSSLLSCNLNNPASGLVLLNSDPLKVLSNISNSMTVPVYQNDGTQYAYVATPPSSRLASLDYTASSYAVTTQCNPVTASCFNPSSISGVSAPYKCPFAFQGAVYTGVGGGGVVGASNSVAEAYFTDSNGSNNDTTNNPIGNPYYHAAMLLMNTRNGRPSGLQNDPEAIEGGHGGSIVALFCTSTVYDVTYSSVNGTITHWTTSPSNNSNTMIVQGTQRLTTVGNPNLIQAATVAGLSDSAQEVANQFALAYSQTALAVSSGAFEPRVASASQVRETILVARVPKAPLFALILANLLLVLLGIILTLVALISLRGNTGEVQARLSIPTLVAALFEGRVREPSGAVEDMFAERHGEPDLRLGFSRSAEGGYVFQTWLPH